MFTWLPSRMGGTKNALVGDFGIMISPGFEPVATQTESRVEDCCAPENPKFCTHIQFYNNHTRPGRYPVLRPLTKTYGRGGNGSILPKHGVSSVG